MAGNIVLMFSKAFLSPLLLLHIFKRLHKILEQIRIAIKVKHKLWYLKEDRKNGQNILPPFYVGHQIGLDYAVVGLMTFITNYSIKVKYKFWFCFDTNSIDPKPLHVFSIYNCQFNINNQTIFMMLNSFILKIKTVLNIIKIRLAPSEIIFFLICLRLNIKDRLLNETHVMLDQ